MSITWRTVDLFSVEFRFNDVITLRQIFLLVGKPQTERNRIIIFKKNDCVCVCWYFCSILAFYKSFLCRFIECWTADDQRAKCAETPADALSWRHAPFLLTTVNEGFWIHPLKNSLANNNVAFNQQKSCLFFLISMNGEETKMNSKPSASFSRQVDELIF